MGGSSGGRTLVIAPAQPFCVSGLPRWTSVSSYNASLTMTEGSQCLTWEWEEGNAGYFVDSKAFCLEMRLLVCELLHKAGNHPQTAFDRLP